MEKHSKKRKKKKKNYPQKAFFFFFGLEISLKLKEKPKCIEVFFYLLLY